MGDAGTRLLHDAIAAVWHCTRMQIVVQFLSSTCCVAHLTLTTDQALAGSRESRDSRDLSQPKSRDF